LVFFEIRDVHGTRLKIWRIGWGGSRRCLFESLWRSLTEQERTQRGAIGPIVFMTDRAAVVLAGRAA
jgi:hypothetical protein